MKYFLISITTIMLLAATTVTAQHANIGVKGGFNSYNIETDNNSNFDSKIGLHLGLLGHIHINDRYAFQPEIYYSMQGAESGGISIRLDYINIPLLLQYMFDNGFRAQAGPQIGVLLNAKGENGSSVDIKDDFKAFDLGVSLGASYIHLSTGFGIDARFNLGLTDISESANLSSTNTGVQIGIFYLFGHRD